MLRGDDEVMRDNSFLRGLALAVGVSVIGWYAVVMTVTWLVFGGQGR